MNNWGQNSLIGQLFDGIKNAIGDVQTVILSLAGSVIVVMLIIGGYQYIMGQKDNGKKTLSAAIIGLIIVILATFIVTLASGLFKL